MTWLLTRTGREHSLTALPHPDTAPSITEIAWSLAHINRYTGHACRAYSVAEHSLLVADIAHNLGASKLTELVCLWHDAHECITGDVTSPVKAMLGSAWSVFEDFHQDGLLMAYDLLEPFRAVRDFVKQCDHVALATERRDLTPFNPIIHKPWPVIDTPGQRVLPWHGAALMQPSQVMRTPSQWAEKFEQRSEALFVALAEEAAAV
ncbi:MAG: YfbR-like 5'-deoxynucleotidase [Rhodoferax sp.]